MTRENLEKYMKALRALRRCYERHGCSHSDECTACRDARIAMEDADLAAWPNQSISAPGM